MRNLHANLCPLVRVLHSDILLVRPTFQYPLAIFVAFSAQKGVHPLTATKGYASGLKCGSPVGCGEPLCVLLGLPQATMTMPNPSADKIIRVFKVILGILGFLGFMYFFSFDDRSLDGYVRFVLSMGGVTFAGFAIIAIFFGLFPWLFEHVVRICKSLGILKRTYETLTKICLAISGSSIVYMFLITYKGTYFGWTVFFVFLALAILFHSLDEKEKEIAMLRWQHSPEGKHEKEERQKAPLPKESPSSPQRLLIPLSLSAEEALAAVKAGLQIGEQAEQVKKQKASQRKASSATSSQNQNKPPQQPKEEEEWKFLVKLPQELPILYPKEIQRLLKMRRIFEQKSETEKTLHKHSWSSAIIPPSPATHNNRETEVCFKCGQIGKKYDKN